jgi:hypothetical protein
MLPWRAKPAIPTSFNPAAFRIAEEKSMGADSSSWRYTSISF